MSRPLPFPVAIVAHLGALVASWASSVAASFSRSLVRVGSSVLLLLRIVARFRFLPVTLAVTFRQMMLIGISSVPLVAVTSFFIGAVGAVSAAYQFRGFIPLKYLGTAVGKSVLIETGPVLTALVLAGRVGSAIAAEIGTMKEKEELDAMAVLDLDPLRYLAMPRMVAGLLMFPVLTILANFLAIVGGWLVALYFIKVTTATYVFGLRFLFYPYDLYVGIIKSVCFGVIVILMGYYHGLHAAPGARGVGNASMKSVVSSSVLILVFDFIVVYLAY